MRLPCSVRTVDSDPTVYACSRKAHLTIAVHITAHGPGCQGDALLFEQKLYGR